MRRAITYSAILTLVWFGLLFALHIATIRLPPSLELLRVTPSERVQLYALFYAGFAMGFAESHVAMVVLALLGSALAFYFLPQGRVLRTREIMGMGAVFALAAFLLDGPATTLLGEVQWSIGEVAIAAALAYIAGCLLSRNAA